MPFQSSVFINQGAGVPGELYTDGPFRVESYTIQSASAAYNIIGATACTKTSQGFCQAGSAGTLGFAGILVDPKSVALFGSAGIPLNPTLTVPNFTQVECATEGTYWVTLPAAAAIGDYVIYDNTTGALSTITPSTPLPVGKTFANAVVDYYTVSGAGLAVITITPTLVIPQPA
jgi:hypothetical protein